MKVGQIIGSAVGCALLLAASIGCCSFFSSTDTDVYGVRKNTVFTHELSFDGSEIGSYDELCDILGRFRRLDAVDLGTFAIDAADEAAFRALFPNTDMTYDSYVSLYGVRFPSDAAEIDISALPVTDETVLMDKLCQFKALTLVAFGDIELPFDKFDALSAQYPGVIFEGIRLYPVGDSMLREDLTEIDFHSIGFDKTLTFDKLLDELAHFEKLERVDLTPFEMSMTQKYELIEQYPGIRFVFPVEVLDGVIVDSGIETLDVSRKRIDDLEAFERTFALFPDLKVVDMCDCGFTNEEMAALRERHPDLKIVWRIRMGKWSLRTDAVAFSVLIYHYDYKRLTSKDIEVLKYCTDLRALDIGHQSISDLSVIGDYLPELRLLILADNRVSDLSPLAKCKHLHYLEFFVDQVTDLSPLAECREMVDLNISYNYGIRDITPLLELPMLERLWLESTAVSAADVQLLRDTYPDAKIVNIGSGSIDQGWRTHKRYYDMINMFLYHTDEPLPESFAMYG